MSSLLSEDGRVLIVAVDHPLYSWPCHGLEDRQTLISSVADAGADAIIASYGTIRDYRDSFSETKAVLKLDLTTVALGANYPVSEYVVAWTVDDAQRVGADGVLTFVQLGTTFELEALRSAALVASAADRAGLDYVCEIMPIAGERFPSEDAPDAIAACARTAAELGASVVKTTMPDPPEAVDAAVLCGRPVILAGGNPTDDTDGLIASVKRALAAGAAGVAFGRNVWGAPDPRARVSRLRDCIHLASQPAGAAS